MARFSIHRKPPRLAAMLLGEPTSTSAAIYIRRPLQFHQIEEYP